jgi:hypothetical protein
MAGIEDGIGTDVSILANDDLIFCSSVACGAEMDKVLNDSVLSNINLSCVTSSDHSVPEGCSCA